jgi:signal transduction histidine kinase
MATPPDLPAPAADELQSPLQAELAEARGQLAFLHELVGVVVHDLKNPLSALLLGVQRLVRMADEAHRPQTQALAHRLEATVLGMNRDVEGLADLSRLGAGRLQLERRREPAADLLLRAVEPLRSVATERRQALVIDLAPDLPPVDCDLERMGRVLAELLGRAVRLSPEGSTVLLRGERHPTGVLATIADQGPGLPPEVLESLLDRRPRPEAGARRVHDLGLLVAKALVEAHGGRFAVESPAGGGCTLRVTLPAA